MTLYLHVVMCCVQLRRRYTALLQGEPVIGTLLLARSLCYCLSVCSCSSVVCVALTRLVASVCLYWQTSRIT